MLEKAKAMMHHACMPHIFWQDVAEVAVHIYNCQSIRHHSWKTPLKHSMENPQAYLISRYLELVPVFTYNQSKEMTNWHLKLNR